MLLFAPKAALLPQPPRKLPNGGIEPSCIASCKWIHSGTAFPTPWRLLSAPLMPSGAQHVPVYSGQGQVLEGKVLSEYVVEHLFVFVCLAVGAPENSTQKDHKAHRQKHIGHDQIPLGVEDGVGDEKAPQANHQEAREEGEGAQNQPSPVLHPSSLEPV